MNLILVGSAAVTVGDLLSLIFFSSFLLVPVVEAEEALPRMLTVMIFSLRHTLRHILLATTLLHRD